MHNIYLKNISFKRIILHLSGVCDDGARLGEAKFFLEEESSHERLEIIDKIVADNTFHLRINVLERKNEYPITTGKWYLICDMPDEKDINISVSDDLKDDIEQAKKKDIELKRDYFLDTSEDEDDSYDSGGFADIEMESELKLLIYKSEENFWSGKSEYNENGSYYLDTEFKIPPSYDSEIRKALKKEFDVFKKSCKRTLSYIRKWAYKQFFAFFNKAVKKRGNKVFFTSDREGTLAGNEKFVYERMVERGMKDKYRFCFDFKDSIKSSRSFLNKFRFAYNLATSDIIFVDDYQPELYYNKYDSNVKIVQLWHACGAFKTIGFERLGKKGSPAFMTKAHKCYTHVTVSSDHSADHNSEAFCLSRDKFYATGIPRCDVFFDENYKKNAREKVFGEYPMLNDGRKVILYAPTFRGNNAKSASFPFKDVGFGKIGKYLKSSGDIMLVKMHPFVKMEQSIPPTYRDCIIDVTEYPDINELLTVTDILVTDYSSVIYEAGLLKVPMLFYAFDFDTYDTDRGFYEPYEEMVPGKIVKSSSELIESLENEDYEEEKLEGFLSKNFKYLDGHSTDRVIDLVFGTDYKAAD